ncbi:SURF1 family protein [Nocardioides dongxiaopingii]|uniref:SURF1 family protein n=1 Tax=Nocardioides sp. S-1144 TaxID=2582905 RepID=UPI00110E0D1F|nr:SURF1 family protein [Nocardioides sp. S-1144]QCW49209.1 SURF1 family protein [Nocardioides sp. S-1144]
MRELLTPRMLGAHLLGLVCVLVAGGLGVWQYEAWQQHRENERVDLTQGEPVALADVLGPDDGFPADRIGQPVEIDGTWLPDATVFVGDRRHEGVDGYWVVTPITSGAVDQPAVPVVRGWVEDPADAPAPPTGAGEVTGWLQPPEGTGAADEDPTDDVFPQLRIADLVQRVDGDLYGAYAVAEGGVDGLPAGDLEELPEPSSTTALKNILYAIEWWVFGAFAGFIWWRFVRESRAPAVADHPVPSST